MAPPLSLAELLLTVLATNENVALPEVVPSL